jgi:pSer/pThr/pTyr-binding forkhead associated (FHA) protein
MQVVLVTFKPSGKQINIPMTSATLTIGRGDECAVRVPAASVSRTHCELSVDGERVRVQDMGSSNGTYVNGDRVKEVFLGPGDMLTVGRVNFRLQIDGEPAEIEPFQPIGADEEDAAANASAPLVSDDEASEPTPPELPTESEDDEDFLAVFEPAASEGDDSVGVFLDEGAEPSEEDPLAALEMLADEPADEDPDLP